MLHINYHPVDDSHENIKPYFSQKSRKIFNTKFTVYFMHKCNFKDQDIEICAIHVIACVQKILFSRDKDPHDYKLSLRSKKFVPDDNNCWHFKMMTRTNDTEYKTLSHLFVF